MIPPYIFIIVGALVVAFALYHILIYFKRDSGIPSVRDEIRYKSKTSTDMSKIAANHQNKVASAITDLNNSLANQAASDVNLDQAAKRAREAHDATEATHMVNMNLLSKALEMNMDSLTYLEVQKKQHFDRLDLEKQWGEIEHKLKGAFIYAERERQYIELHKELIFKLYEERKLLEGTNALAKDEKLNFMNEWIKGEERVFNERAGLLQASTQKDSGGSGKNSDFPGDIR
jgi:hypothetical protein